MQQSIYNHFPSRKISNNRQQVLQNYCSICLLLVTWSLRLHSTHVEKADTAVPGKGVPASRPQPELEQAPRYQDIARHCAQNWYWTFLCHRVSFSIWWCCVHFAGALLKASEADVSSKVFSIRAWERRCTGPV